MTDVLNINGSFHVECKGRIMSHFIWDFYLHLIYEEEAGKTYYILGRHEKRYISPEVYQKLFELDLTNWPRKQSFSEENLKEYIKSSAL